MNKNTDDNSLKDDYPVLLRNNVQMKLFCTSFFSRHSMSDSVMFMNNFDCKSLPYGKNISYHGKIYSN